MANWVVKNENQEKTIGKFESREDAIDATLKLVSERFTNIKDIVDNTLRQQHTEICKNFIEKFRDFPNSRTANLLGLFADYYEAYDEGETWIEESEFHAEWKATETTIFTIKFGDDLAIETNIWTPEDANYYFILVGNKSERLQYSIQNTLPEFANIFLVYNVLSKRPQSRSEIRKNIVEEYGKDGYGYDIDLCEDTISNHIHSLQALGIPIYEKQLPSNEKLIKKALIDEFGDEFREGFYIDNSRPISCDYSKISPRVYVMLVYLVLKESDESHPLPTQQAIVDAVYNKFGTKIKRSNVKNYIDILTELNVWIEHDKSGYWM